DLVFGQLPCRCAPRVAAMPLDGPFEAEIERDPARPAELFARLGGVDCQGSRLVARVARHLLPARVAAPQRNDAVGDPPDRADVLPGGAKIPRLATGFGVAPQALGEDQVAAQRIEHV